MGIDYYDWLKSVHKNQTRFKDFLRKSNYPEKYDLKEFIYLLHEDLSIVEGVNGGFEVHSSGSYKYADIPGHSLQDAQERLDDCLSIIVRKSSSIMGEKALRKKGEKHE